MADRILQVAIDKKGSDILLLDLRKVTTIADYFVICTGATERQIRAISQAVMEDLEHRGIAPLHDEGLADSGWILLDYGDVVVHVFTPSERDYYRLEKAWSDALPVVRVQ